MRGRVDFVSRTTGRTYLKSMFDTPTEGFTAALTLKVRRKLVHFSRELEDYISKEVGKTVYVRLTMDNYEACVFWYCVLFRPFFVERHPILGLSEWSVYELMNDRSKAHMLKRLDWGIFWDEDNNWLVLVWEEALEGVLKDLRKCVSWDAVLRAEEKRVKKKLEWSWWKKCSESFAYVVPQWQLRNMGYIKEKLWHRPGTTYDNITVLDVSGIDIPRFEVGHDIAATLPVAKRARFAHHYVDEDDKRTYMASIRKYEKQERRRSNYGLHREHDNQRRREKREENRTIARHTTGGKLARIVSQLGTALGKPYRKGRPPRSLTPEECEARFNHTLDAYVNGQLIKPNWRKTERLLDELEKVLSEKDSGDDTDYNIARRWLLWRKKGNPGILALIEKRRGNSALYKEILKGCITSERRQLVELIEQIGL